MGIDWLKIIIVYGIEALTWIIVIDALLTFIPNLDRRHPIVKFMRSITEPMYRQVRKVIPTMQMGEMGFDLSPLIVIIVLNIVRAILFRIL